MNIGQLKEVIASLPDDMEVYISVDMDYLQTEKAGVKKIFPFSPDVKVFVIEADI
jgi:hypothetical protein